MTKREAAIVSAYTGFLIGNFAEMQAYADEKLGRETQTVEFGRPEVAARLKRLSKADFCAIEVK